MGMDMLQQLLGGGQQRQEYQDFTQRYDQGAPWDGISDQDAHNRFQQVAPRLPPDMYRQSAQQHLSGWIRSRGCNSGNTCSSRPSNITGQMHQQQPGILGQLLGSALGGGGAGAGQGALDSPIAKAALAGIAAMAVKQMMGNR